MGLITKACPQCGTGVLRGLNDTCSKCGAAVHGLYKVCTGTRRGLLGEGPCNDLQPPDSQVCSRCGTPFDRVEARITTHVWRRTYEKGDQQDGRPLEIARRFDFGDEGLLPGLRATTGLAGDGDAVGGIVVESGMQAHLIRNHNVVVSLPSGFWAPKAVADKLKLATRDVAVGEGAVTSAILVEAHEFPVDFQLKKLLTRDRQALELDLLVSLRIAAFERFLETVLKGQQEYTYKNLRQWLWKEVQNAVAEALSSRDADALRTAGLELKRALEEAVRAHLAQTLDRTGIEVAQVRAIEFRGEWLDADSELGKVGLAEKRNLVWERLTQVDVARRAKEADFDKVLLDIQLDVAKRAVLRTEEVAELKRTLEERRGDHVEARRRIWEKAELEHGVEKERIAVLAAGRLDGEKAELEVAAARVRLEGELAEKRLRDADARDAKLADTLKDLEGRERSAEVEDRIRRLKLERGLHARERKDALDLKRKADELRLRLEEDRERQRLDLERERMMLDQMKDWSEDKILAWLSQRSESSAQALVERARASHAANSQGQRVLESTLERVLRVLERQPGPALTLSTGPALAVAPQAAVRLVVCPDPGCRAQTPQGQPTCSRCGGPLA